MMEENENLEIVKEDKPDSSNGILTKVRAQAENLLVLVIGIYGIFHAVFLMDSSGGSRTMNVSIFPRLIYVLMIIAGIGMFLSKNKYAPPPKEQNVSTCFLLVYLASLYAYFWGVMNIGLAVSTAVYLLLQFLILDPAPKEHIKETILAAAIGTVLLWLMYNVAIDIYLPDPLLF